MCTILGFYGDDRFRECKAAKTKQAGEDTESGTGSAVEGNLKGDQRYVWQQRGLICCSVLASS